MVEEYNELVGKLKNYICELFHNNNIDGNQLKSYLIEFGLSHILSDLIQDEETQRYIQITEFIQNIRNKKMISEIERLSNLAIERNIKIILLKGVDFGNRYYPHPEKRITEDIDVFLDKKDFRNYICICRKHGFTGKDGNAIDDVRAENFILEKWLDQHFDVIVKNIGSGLNSIAMDVHVRLFQQHWFGGLCFKIPMEFYSRSEPLNGFRGMVYGLELHDMLIYHQLHFIQHLHKNIWTGFVDGQFFFQKKINLLFEIACIIKNNNINWSYYTDLCLKYQINMEIASVCTFVNQIFGEVFPFDIVQKLIYDRKKYNKNVFYDKFSEYTLHLDFSDLLVKPAINIVKDFVKSLLPLYKKYICQKDMTKFFILHAFPLNEVWQSHIGNSILASDKMMLEVILHWNEKYFIVDIKADYQGVPLLKYLEKSNQIKNDCISIALFDYTMKSNDLSTRAVKLNLCKQSGVIQCEADVKNVEVACLQQYEILRVQILWSVLDIVPALGTCLGFNMEWCHFEEEKYRYTKISISENPTWHDIVSMKQVILHK